ncbi:MAG TPA: PorP/SprF family type IX secretion system membrane protein [Cyclobacteriaceae bacterium]|nr:PorP/SprF family type IX secretion system membrane protein [Cyclobacteriaceae bacterium]
MNRPLQFCLWLVISFFAFKASAQDNTDFAQFFVNSASLNPSYTGIDGQPALYLGFRRQWAGVPDGPTLGQVSLQGLVAGKLTGGLTVSSNKRGLLSTSAVLFTGGYHVMVAEDKMIRFGLSIGSAFNRVDAAGIVNANPDDPAITTAVRNNLFIQGNAGVSFHSKTFHAGFALPQLFKPAYSSTEAFSVTSISPFQSVVLHASNRFYFNRNKNVFEPYIIYRLNQFTPSQFEIASIVHLENKLWFGASFRQGLGASAMAGIKLNKAATLGYSFTTGFSKETQIIRPTHEIQLALLFGKRHKNAVGIYSFVNTEKEKKKKSPAQLAAERKARQEAMAKKYQQTNVHNEPHKTAEKTPEPKKEEPRKEETVVQQQQQQPRVDSVVVAPVVPAKPERHEFVKRERNKNDLPAGTYVIVGAFRSEVNARKFSNELLDMEYTEANYGFISARNLWYVYMGYDEDVNKAREIRDKTRHEHNFKDAWILTVE